MATVDLSRVQFWQPPLNPSSSKQRPASLHIRKNSRSGSTDSSRNQLASLPNKADKALRRDNQVKPAGTATRPQGRDLTPQHEVNAVRAQGRDNDPANGDDEADDDLTLIDELLAFSSKGISTVYQDSADTPQHLEGPALNTSRSRLGPNPRPDDGVGNSQGTRDRPLILEDDESDTPEFVPQAAAVSVSVDADANPASELSNGRWYDVEDKCYVDDDLRPIPPLEHEGLASTPTLAQPHSYHHPPRSSQDQINQHDDDGMGGAPDEPAPPTLPQPLGESGGGSDENASELERDMQLAFEEQEEHDRGGTSCGRPEELGRGLRRRSQDRGEEAQEQQQRQEVAVELMREDGGGGGGKEPEERGEKRRHPDETEIGSDTHHPEASDHSHDTGDEGDEGDEDDEGPRPAKRRRLPPAPTVNALTPPDEPTPVANDDHHPLQTSRSPSVTVESALVAEYQEWPFRGFLKRTKIGNKTIYNLEFQLPHIPEHLHSEALGVRSNKEASLGAATPHDASTHSKVRPATLQAKRKRVPWTPEEDAILCKMKEVDGCSWEEIAKALPHRTPGTIQVHYSTSRAGVGEADVSGGQQQKRRRGRPRKQT